MMNAKLKEGGKADFNFPADYATVLLLMEGSAKVNNGETIPTDHLALMAKEGEQFEMEAAEDGVVLVLSGKRINERIAAHGPFVMNTQEDVIEAAKDFNEGKVGEL